MMSWLLLLRDGKKKKKKKKKKGGERKIGGFRKKLMIPESEMSECPEHEVKSRIGNIFVNEKVLEYYKIDPYCYEHYKKKKKKYKLMKMNVNIYYLELVFILLNIFYL